MLEDPVETRLYLSAPPLTSADAEALAAMLATGIACLGVDIAGFLDGEAEALERVIGIADEAGCALVVGGDDAIALDLAGRFAIDGVHLNGPAVRVADARKRLGTDTIIGYDAGLSRTDALIAAEAGADYVMLSPVADLESDLAEWWQAVIETPLVLGGIATLEQIDGVKGIADFAMIAPDYAAGNAKDFVIAAAERLR